MMVNFDCSALWLKDYDLVADAFDVNPIYLKHRHDNNVMDFRHLQLPLSRRFRSLKLWFVFRLLGVKAIQENVRKVRKEIVLFLLKTHFKFLHIFAQY